MKEISTVRITIVKRNRKVSFHIRQEVPRAFQFMLTIKLLKRVGSKSSFNNIGILTVVLMHLQRSTHHEVQQKILKQQA